MRSQRLTNDPVVDRRAEHGERPSCDNRSGACAIYAVIVDAVIVIAGIALIAFALTLLARKARRRGIAGAALAGAMAAYNEGLAHDRVNRFPAEMQSQADRVVPSHSPEDL